MQQSGGAATYLQKQFVYDSKAFNIVNYYWLGLVTAGLIALGMKHVMVGILLLAIERGAKHATMPDAVGVSAITTSISGYLITTAAFHKKWRFVVIGLLASVGHIRSGLEPFNLQAHLLPFLGGCMVAIIIQISFPTFI